MTINIAYCLSCKKYFKDAVVCPSCDKKLTNHLESLSCIVDELNINEAMIKLRDKEIATFAKTKGEEILNEVY